MEDLGITPIIEPIRGGTDGSKISFMGIPTPNIFAGGENMHGRFEYVSLQTMERAVDTIIGIVAYNKLIKKSVPFWLGSLCFFYYIYSKTIHPINTSLSLTNSCPAVVF